MSPHLAVAPILIPLLTTALQLVLPGRRHHLRAALSLFSCALLVVAAVGLLATVATADVPVVYNPGGWPARFAIVLVVDRLSALMLLLTAVLALAVMPYALGRWRHMGVFFQPLMQLLLLGFNGAFLTGDLFNLFVFFEVLLAASYGLALHGSGMRRVGAGLHYIAINLLASMLFLLGLGLIFGVTGTLNMAMLARRMPELAGNARTLVHAGAVLAGMAFLTKAAIWPLGFWLPRTYAAATPPVAALFAVMTKLGIYVLLRLSLLLFGAGAAAAHFGSGWLLWAGIITVLVGGLGVLGARELGRLAGFCVLISSGTLLGAFALQQPDVTAGALAYMVVSVFAIAAFFLLIGLIVPPAVQQAPEGSAQLEPYDPASDALFADEVEVRVATPVPVMTLSASFFLCALLLVGLPPLSGFLAKFALLAPMVGQSMGANVLFALIITAGLCMLVATCRAGIQIFWADVDWSFPHARASETASVLALLGICIVLTVVVSAPWAYLADTAQHLHDPAHYIDAVLTPAPEAAL